MSSITEGGKLQSPDELLESGQALETIASYFDARAEGWETNEPPEEAALRLTVARMAGVNEGSAVLDLGSGQGVMMASYLELGASHILGVDISSAMVDQGRKRWAAYPGIEFLVADAATMDVPGFQKAFDAVVIYNAYPHFMDRRALVANCARLLRDGGRFIVAHGAGREAINAHHEAVAAGVSLGLEAPEMEAVPWEETFVIDGMVDTPAFYAFCGFKRS